MPGRKLVVEVVSASHLSPKDGDGTSSPYVEVEFDGQRLRTKTKSKDLNPTWNQKLEFEINVADLDDENVEVTVYTDKKPHRSSLGRVKIHGFHIKKKGTEGAEVIIPYQLERRGLFSLFSRGKGEIFLKTYYYEDTPKEKAKEEKKETSTAEKKDPEKKADGDAKAKEGGGTEAKKFEAKSMAGTTYEELEAGSFDVKTTHPKLSAEKVSHDLVAPMDYLFVRVVKARDLAARDLTRSSDPYTEVKVGNRKALTEVKSQTLKPEWNRVFAFERQANQAQTVQITVWDKDTVTKDDFLGYLEFEIAEIPERHPPDSPLAPQWYKLEAKKDEKRVKGEIMLAVWMGTQSDEAFPDAWQSDTGGVSLNRSKVYISPRLWYLRVRVLEGQDLFAPGKDIKIPEVAAVVELGPQIHARQALRRTVSPSFNPDEILFVAAEPFMEALMVKVVNRVSANKDEVIGVLRLPVQSIPRRSDRKPVPAKWYDLEKEKKAEEAAKNGGKSGVKNGGPTKAKFTSRIHISASLDGGYHVLDETTHHSSDVRPTDRRLWKKPLGILELGIIAAHNLLPTKTREGKGSADAYCIAKYGEKWIRTRTVVESLSPQWNEQYTWNVYDPCTVLTVGVFDNHHHDGGVAKKAEGAKDTIIGKIRIRLSTLQTDRTYNHLYPLIGLERGGVKKRGDIELAVRFSCLSRFNIMHAYIQPLLPKLHYVEPLSVRQVDALRKVATNILITHLHRAEPPIRSEVIHYMLDTDARAWSYRRSKSTWRRFLMVFAGVGSFFKWIADICCWKSPVTTVLVIILYMILVCFPQQILPTLFLYVFLIGLWHYRFKPSHPPHMDIKLSEAASVEADELDEEFDTYPSSKSPEIVKIRYERMRRLAGRVQAVLTDLVTQLERFHALLSWRDPRATFIFILFCLLIAIILYVVPFRVIAVLFGLYFFRHPRFRAKLPGAPMNFFRRLPALSDCIL